MTPLRAAFLETDARAKAASALTVAHGGSEADWPDRPGRPAAPRLVAARAVAKRSPATPAGRIALLHALAHIELNAVDLALDIIGRFAGAPEIGVESGRFTAEWLSVAHDEARHFLMLSDRLEALGSAYGALDAHDGLWQTALASRQDVLARLAIAPLTHEARGLDVTPAMIAKLKEAGDPDSAAILEVIYRDEIGHVATGYRWFRHVCRARGVEAEAAFAVALGEIGLARPHAPFNEPARREAGLTPAFDITFSLPPQPTR